jgi:TonB family protein
MLRSVMSSIRAAAGSCVLVVALSASWLGAVNAFPLYGGVQTQAPPRDPLGPNDHHRAAVEYFEKARKDTTLTTEQKRQTILKGIAAENRALAIRPDYVEALVYKGILLRLQAGLSADRREIDALIKQADALRSRALELQAGRPPVPIDPTMPPPPPPPPPPAPPPAEFQAVIDQHKAVRVGGNLRVPMRTRDVPPVYPPIAQVSRVQGVVIIEAVIDETGRVVEARVLRSIPLLDQAALDAVKQWEYAPTHVNNVPTAVVMTVTVNFNLQ